MVAGGIAFPFGKGDGSSGLVESASENHLVAKAIPVDQIPNDPRIYQMNHIPSFLVVLHQDCLENLHGVSLGQMRSGPDPLWSPPGGGLILARRGVEHGLVSGRPIEGSFAGTSQLDNSPQRGRLNNSVWPVRSLIRALTPRLPPIIETSSLFTHDCLLGNSSFLINCISLVFCDEQLRRIRSASSGFIPCVP